MFKVLSEQMERKVQWRCLFNVGCPLEAITIHLS